MKYLSKITVAAMLLSLVGMMTSCDSEADKVKFEEEVVSFYGKFNVKLYVPEYGIESLDSCVVPKEGMASLRLQVDDDNTMGIFSNKVENAHFRIQFLDDNGNVLQRYANGTLAHLYNRLKAAYQEGILNAADFEAFRDEVRYLCDTITVYNLQSYRMPAVVVGCVLSTYDPEQGSPYSRFNIYPAKYVRKSNLFNALQTLRPTLEAWAQEGKLTEQEIAELNAIKDQRSNTISDGGGWCVLSYANIHLEAEMHLEKATHLLDTLAVALFGRDASGKPAKEVWVVFNFKGDSTEDGRYVRIGE